jgi:DNA-binding PadR family transcriptional regulator
MNDLIILALLSQGPKHGYQLKREAGFILRQEAMHNNLVYPLLRRFTKQGLVSKKTTPGQRGQTRQQYALTAKGRKDLVQRLAEFSDEDARSPEAFATRVGMFDLLKLEARLGILSRREAYLSYREQRLAALKANMDVGTYGGEVARFLVEQGQAERLWIERLRRMQKQKSRGESGGADSR